MKLVKITWVDSTTMSEDVWGLKDEVLKPLTVKSVGYIQKETKDYIALVGSYTDYQVCNRITIPKGCIKKVKKYG